MSNPEPVQNTMLQALFAAGLVERRPRERSADSSSATSEVSDVRALAVQPLAAITVNSGAVVDHGRNAPSIGTAASTGIALKNGAECGKRIIEVGEILPSQPKGITTPIASKPHSQPSVFWKAMAVTLLPLLSIASDLRDEDQALFLTTPTQAGIPGGFLVPEEVTRFQIFCKSDTVQRLGHVGYSLDGDSYFRLLMTFFRNLKSTADDQDIEKARASLQNATGSKDETIHKIIERYDLELTNGLHAPANRPAPSLHDFLAHDPAYKKAVNSEEKAHRKYTNLQANEQDGISRQLEIMKSADDLFSPSTYNNMPVSAMNQDYVRRHVESGKPIVVDKASIFYKPFYDLPGWETVVNNWVVNNNTPRVYPINFKGLSQVTWASFGHEELDGVAPTVLTDQQRALVEGLQGKISFYNQPRVMDVERGLWDVNRFRHAGNLTPQAPQAVRDCFCKTTRLLLTWGFSIELQLPESISKEDVQEINLAFLQVPLASVSDDHKTLRFSTESTAYPWLIAALAAVV